MESATTESIATWMRDEHDKLAQLMGAIRGFTSAPQSVSEGWLAELRERFAHLRAHMQKHMALEEAGGYLSPVRDRRPTLTPKIERLRHEHVEIGALMTGIHLALGGLTPSDRLCVLDLCRRIGTLLEFMDRHEETENLLVCSTLNEDLGDKD